MFILVASILMFASPVFFWDAVFHGWTPLDATLKKIRVRGEQRPQGEAELDSQPKRRRICCSKARRRAHE